MASGCSYKDLHYAYRVGVSTISNIIKEVTNAVWNNLHGEFMTLPNTISYWKYIANGFNTRANFPHCIGAVDGKHIRVKKSNNSGSMFMNYKDFFPSYYKQWLIHIINLHSSVWARMEKNAIRQYSRSVLFGKN